MDIFYELKQREEVRRNTYVKASNEYQQQLHRNFKAHWRMAADEVLRLKWLAKHQKRLHKNLNMHFATVEMIRQFEHEGRLYLEESGIDCDCIQYSGTIHEIDANPYALRKLEEEISRRADGPFCLQPLRFEDVKHIRYVTRDLAAEAFEAGHPHVAHSFIAV
jgi:hypothetical protein